MDDSRRKLSFRWLRTVTSPKHLQRSDTDSNSSSPWNMSLNESPGAASLGDSPGPEGLAALSLDTPKRKADSLGGRTSSAGKVKLRKLSKKKFETLITSDVSCCCKSVVKSVDEITD